jgi:hypothetical protein
MLVQDDKLSSIREAFPKEGLFAEKDWLLSPDPFPIEEQFARELEQLGHRLFVFQRACNQLYQLSVKGKQPAWVAKYLDAGKPAELIEFSRRKEIRDDLPKVIRPDLVLTDEGYTIAEIDSVPGGIGLTGWLNQIYSKLGGDVIGGSDGMLEGFQNVLPKGGDIVVSEEAATYRPEMEWLAARLKDRHPDLEWRVVPAENYEPRQIGLPSPQSSPSGRGGREAPGEGFADVYRFFELFDLPNIPNIDKTLRAVAEEKIKITPPIKPYLEEKMWFALFWMQPLHEFWRRELGEKYFQQLQQSIPYSWLLDPTPLPQHAVIPRLEIHDWREAGRFSQKDRHLLLKVSGFSPLGWGSRGISLGSDLAHAEWEKRIDNALATFETSPTILQKFHKGRLFDHRYWDRDSGELKTMKGRVRLCPYYFVEDNKVKLHGALATIVPADKKLLHGMSDAILVPTKIAERAG